MKRPGKPAIDLRDVTTTIASLIACGIMGIAVHSMMSKRQPYRAPGPMESLSIPGDEAPAKTSPPPSKPVRTSRALTA